MLRRRYFPDASEWVVERGSALNRAYVGGLGLFDIVYSWGVLHHTGAMWEALDIACGAVADNGRLCVALYNDQGGASGRWAWVKRTYNELPAPIPQGLVLAVGTYFETRQALIRLVRRQNPFSPMPGATRSRGMSRWHDLVDWVGGYPFEVASPDQVFSFCRDRGFELRHLATAGGGHACNEFVFERAPAVPPAPRPGDPGRA